MADFTDTANRLNTILRDHVAANAKGITTVMAPVVAIVMPLMRLMQSKDANLADLEKAASQIELYRASVDEFGGYTPMNTPAIRRVSSDELVPAKMFVMNACEKINGELVAAILA
jgi:tagatose-1,6-bisphosphate aldolase non-catalytic subunit AgaZ/GatZ